MLWKTLNLNTPSMLKKIPRARRLRKECYSACGKTSPNSPIEIQQRSIQDITHMWLPSTKQLAKPWRFSEAKSGSSGLKPNFVCIARASPCHAILPMVKCRHPGHPGHADVVPDSLYSLSTTPTLCTSELLNVAPPKLRNMHRQGHRRPGVSLLPWKVVDFLNAGFVKRSACLCPQHHQETILPSHTSEATKH